MLNRSGTGRDLILCWGRSYGVQQQAEPVQIASLQCAPDGGKGYERTVVGDDLSSACLKLGSCRDGVMASNSIVKQCRGSQMLEASSFKF